MERINENKLKPRRTRGTPSYYYRNRVAFAFIAAGTAIAAIWVNIPTIRRVDKKIVELFSKPSEEDIDRRALFNFAAPRTAASIRKTLEEKENFYKER